jgi:dUTP pyrophosphatase
VDVPEDVMGEIYVRSSLFCSGVAIYAGLVNSEYRGSVGEVL